MAFNIVLEIVLENVFCKVEKRIKILFAANDALQHWIRHLDEETDFFVAGRRFLT